MNASHAITTQSSSNARTRLDMPAVGRQVGRTLGALGTAMGLALAALPASANLLANPGFETSTIIPYSTLLAGPIVTGIWGHENSAIVGAMPPIMPFQTQMLQMSNAGGAATQAGQFIAVAGNTSMTFSALFNADLPAALANISVTFFSGNTYASQMAPFTGLIGAGLALDAVASTWQPLSVTGAVPGAAQYALAQVWYSNASLIDRNGTLGMGYVDETFAAAVPEPQTYALMALGVAVLGFKLRRRSGVAGS